MFLVDDFGRERVSPDQLLNRFITPMEHQIDYFTLRTGQKIELPLRHVLIIATNLSPEVVTDPAFLRRLGYRLYLGRPPRNNTPRFSSTMPSARGATVAPELIAQCWSVTVRRTVRCALCEPRDLIERARDICRFRGKSFELTPEVLDLAWIGYFGEL